MGARVNIDALGKGTEPEVERLQTIIDTFNQLFLEPFNTCLIGGAEEPVYLPADNEHQHHRLYFREDYLSSALHEVAHWCIAGPERRKQVDFGYWYNPDGRTVDQQQVFEQVEVKPQALEWMFSVACQQPFRVSADNLAAGIGASESFFQAIACQVQEWCLTSDEMPVRGQQFSQALANRFSVDGLREPTRYQRSLLS